MQRLTSFMHNRSRPLTITEEDRLGLFKKFSYGSEAQEVLGQRTESQTGLGTA